MPLLREPVITLEDIRLRKISLSSLDLDVVIRVENPNLPGVTLRELPVTVFCRSGSADEQLAAGNPGRVKIPSQSSTIIRIPVTSRNAALIRALAALVTKGGVQVTIRGSALIDAVFFSWSIPFEKTLPVTLEDFRDSLTLERTSG